MMSSLTKGTAYCGRSESMLPELDLKVKGEGFASLNDSVKSKGGRIQKRSVLRRAMVECYGVEGAVKLRPMV